MRISLLHATMVCAALYACVPTLAMDSCIGQALLQAGNGRVHRAGQALRIPAAMTRGRIPGLATLPLRLQAIGVDVCEDFRRIRFSRFSVY